MVNTHTSPYQTGFAQQPTSSNEDLKKHFEIQKDEESKTHKAPGVLPNTLQTLTDQIGDIFVKFIDIRGNLELAKQNTDREKEINHIQNIIDNINNQIFDLTNELDKIKI